jgi:1,4-alpha-glucan branching enzyme
LSGLHDPLSCASHSATTLHDDARTVTKSELACWPVGLALAVSSVAASAEQVTFRLHAPAAREVFLSGTFTGWQGRQPLHRAADGSWSIVLDLQPGRYEYVYVVDGRWTPNPDAASLPDGLGGRNNVLVVPTR